MAEDQRPQVIGYRNPDEDWFENQRDFGPIRFIDAPSVALTQLLQGEASFDTLRRTFFEDESLSPEERDSYRDTLKKKYGGNRVSNTAIDIVTNPLTWLLFLGGPIGYKALRGNGGRLFHQWASKGFQWLGALGGTSVSQVVSNPAVTIALSRGEQLARGEHYTFADEVGGQIQALLRRSSQKHGISIDSLDPQKLRGGSAKHAAAQEDLRELNALLNGHLHGHDKSTLVNRVLVQPKYQMVGHRVGLTGAGGAPEVLDINAKTFITLTQKLGDRHAKDAAVVHHTDRLNNIQYEVVRVEAPTARPPTAAEVAAKELLFPDLKADPGHANRVIIETAEVKALTTRNLEDALRAKYGEEAVTLANAIRKYQNGAVVRRFGDQLAHEHWVNTFRHANGREPTSADMLADRSWFVTDQRKFKAFQEKIRKDPDYPEEFDFLGPNSRKLMDWGLINSKSYMDEVAGGFTAQIRSGLDRYMARNVTTAYQTVGPKALQRGYDTEGLRIGGGRDLKNPSMSAHTRTQEEPIWEVEYLDALGPLTKAGMKMRRVSESKKHDSLAISNINGFEVEGWLSLVAAH